MFLNFFKLLNVQFSKITKSVIVNYTKISSKNQLHTIIAPEIKLKFKIKSKLKKKKKPNTHTLNCVSVKHTHNNIRSACL